MLKDFLTALPKWRVIHLIGLSALRGRFARSKLGQAWISISIFANICIFGVVWAMIWNVPVAKYLPHVGIGNVIYLFTSQTVNESTSIFIANAKLYINQKLPLSLSVLAHIYRSLIVLAYNMPIVLFLFFWSPYTKLNLNPFIPLGFLLTILFLIFSSYTLSIICVRFRDLIQVIGVIMQSIFLISPVMWDISMIPEKYRNYVYINPFASMLDILRSPLLGENTSHIAYLSLAGWCLFFILCAGIVHQKFSKNIVFWM